MKRWPPLVNTLALTALVFAASSQSAWAQTAPTLGTAKSFAVVGASTVTNTGPSTVHGDLGVSPGTAVTGFPPGLIVPPGVQHAADAVALQAQLDVVTVYNSLAGQACLPGNHLTGQDLGGKTLVKGVYCFDSSAQLTGALTLNAQGNSNAVFIFQIGSTLTTASSSSVKLINGAQPCNIFWQVGSSATLGTTTSFIGNILAMASITLNTGASLNGRALARTAAVTLDSNDVYFSACATGTTSNPDVGPIPGSGPGPNGTPDTPPVASAGPICTELKAPKVVLSKVIWGPPTTWFVTIQDTGSGLASIVVNVSQNVTPHMTAFPLGYTGAIVVSATKIINEADAAFGVQVTDLCGNVTVWDPVEFAIKANQTVTVHGIMGLEHFVTIDNDGLRGIIITINGNDTRVIWLGPEANRTINLGRFMEAENNTLTFEALGRKRDSAKILIHPR